MFLKLDPNLECNLQNILNIYYKAKGVKWRNIKGGGRFCDTTIHSTSP